MKILLTNPGFHYSHGPTYFQPDWPSLTLPYVAAIAGKHDVRIFNNHFLKTYDGLENEVKSFKPDIVGFSIMACCDVDRMLEETKRIDCVKIAGGQGAHYHKEKFENAGVRVFDDESELALPHFLETGEIKKFDRINLDDSPIPRWDIVPRFKSKSFKTYTGAMEMSRGCPFHCAFCMIADFWHSSRVKSNDRIMEELKYLYSLDRRHVYMCDDNYGWNIKKHMDLFEMILSAGLKIKWFTQIRADTCAKNPEFIKMAAKTGLYGVLVGFDSYDNEVLIENTKTTNIDINNGAARVLHENGVLIVGSHIYALPGMKSFDKTFKMGTKNSDLFLMPYCDQRPKVERPGYDPVYARYARRDQFSLKSILFLFHPNKAIRTLKWGALKRYIFATRGYKKDWRKKRASINSDR